MKCLFCNIALNFDNRFLAYCFGHDPKRVIFSRFEDKEEIQFYLISNNKYRAIVYPNDHIEVDAYLKNDKHHIYTKNVVMFYETCDITPDNFETKINTIVTFL
jgi:hypothetical protein